MRKTCQIKYSVRLPRELDDAMEKICSKRRGVTKTQIIVAALEEFLFPEGADRKEVEFSRFLSRLERKFALNERYLEILAETISLYIRVWLTNTMELPEDQQEQAKRVGGKRYRVFLEHLGKRLQAGQTMLNELPGEVLMKPEEFFSKEDAENKGGNEGEAV